MSTLVVGSGTFGGSTYGYNTGLDTGTVKSNYRNGSTTRGKRKGIIYIIKVL